ncbi:hypothetical protein J6590_077483 [Homalodisca vitripennis]|nr:hypothetical protein J6590_077483 [Homalodisca vitripennis]
MAVYALESIGHEEESKDTSCEDLICKKYAVNIKMKKKTVYLLGIYRPPSANLEDALNIISIKNELIEEPLEIARHFNQHSVAEKTLTAVGQIQQRPQPNELETDYVPDLTFLPVSVIETLEPPDSKQHHHKPATWVPQRQINNFCHNKFH